MGSHISIPNLWATFLDTGSYSSGVISLSVRIITLSLGAASECLRVGCITYDTFKSFTFSITSFVLPLGMLSRSRVINERLNKFVFLRFPSFSFPATNPPTSFRLSCCDFFSFINFSYVSVVLVGFSSLLINSLHSSFSVFQCVSLLLPAVDIIISLFVIFSSLQLIFSIVHCFKAVSP